MEKELLKLWSDYEKYLDELMKKLERENPENEGMYYKILSPCYSRMFLFFRWLKEGELSLDDIMD